MKKLNAFAVVFLAIFCLFATSCENFMRPDFEPTFPKLPDGVNSLETAFTWTSTNVAYLPDVSVHHMTEFWQSGAETLYRHTGGDTDFAIMLCCFCHSLGMDARLVTGQGFAKAKINGVLYDCKPFKAGKKYFPRDFAKDTGTYKIEYEADIYDVLIVCYKKYGSR